MTQIIQTLENVIKNLEKLNMYEIDCDEIYELQEEISNLKELIKIINIFENNLSQFNANYDDDKKIIKRTLWDCIYYSQMGELMNKIRNINGVNPNDTILFVRLEKGEFLVSLDPKMTVINQEVINGFNKFLKNSILTQIYTDPSNGKTVLKYDINPTRTIPMTEHQWANYFSTNKKKVKKDFPETFNQFEYYVDDEDWKVTIPCEHIYERRRY